MLVTSGESPCAETGRHNIFLLAKAAICRGGGGPMPRGRGLPS